MPDTTYSVAQESAQLQSAPWVELIEGDCREVMAALPPDADCCIADPPYGDTSLAWDSAAKGWVGAVAKALKPNGSLWLFGSLRYLASLWPELEAAGFVYSQDVVWEKQNGTGFHNDRFRRVHEHAALFYRGRWRDVYHDAQRVEDCTPVTTRNKRRPTHTGLAEKAPFTSRDGGPKLARSVLRVTNMHGRAVHPTQKPEGIVEPLLRYSTPPGGLVLAPFCGSGTVAAVARACGRNCIATELSPDFYSVASERLWPAATEVSK